MNDGLTIHEIRQDFQGEVQLGKLIFARAYGPMPIEKHTAQYEIVYMHSGYKVFYIHEQRHILTGGDILLVFPGEPHGADTETQNRTTLYYLIFPEPKHHPGFLGLNDDERCALSQVLQNAKERLYKAPAGFHKYLQQLFTLYASDSPLRLARMRHCVLELIWQATHNSSLSSVSHSIPDDISRSIACIKKNTHIIPTLTELAAMVYLSVPRFKQKFKNATGIPPAEFIMREKVNLAKTLLENANDTITHIAMDLGFGSSQHFSVVFKKYTGESPLVYRSNATCFTGKYIRSK